VPTCCPYLRVLPVASPSYKDPSKSIVEKQYSNAGNGHTLSIQIFESFFNESNFQI
jgi:hypothetical protein